MSDLEMAIARAFKLRGKSRLNRTELTFALAYELKWFTPEECKEVLDAALAQGLLKEENGKLLATFNVKAVEVPGDFKPGPDVLKKQSVFDRTLDMLAAAGIERSIALQMVGELQKRYGGLITPETAALVIAKEKKLDVGAYIDEALVQLLKKVD